MKNYDENCFHCTKEKPLEDFMIKVKTLQMSTLYLFRDQTYRGRCVLSVNKHINEIFELTEAEQILLMHDLAAATKAIHMVFQPDNINYGAFSDTLLHLHFHLVPKYKDGTSWGSMFEMSPKEKVILTDIDYKENIASLLKNIAE